MSLFDSISTGAQMALPVAGGVIGGYFGGPMGAMAGASAGTAVSNFWVNHENFQAQQRQYNYQKRLQSEIFSREDSAIMRRVADLQNAGLSPVLAAGSGAGSGAIASTRAPEKGFNPDVAIAVMNMIKMKEDISNTVAQRRLIESQADLAEIGSAIKNWDLNKYVEWNLPSNASGLAKTIRDLGSLLQGVPNILKGPVNELKDKVVPEGDRNPYKRKFEPQRDPIKDFFQNKGWLPKTKG